MVTKCSYIFNLIYIKLFLNIMIYLVLLIPILLLVLEGLQDYYIWKASTYDKYEYTIKWHNVKFFIIFFTYTLISILYFDNILDIIIYLFYISGLRISVFNLTYNILRGRKPWYFSSTSNIVDILFSKYPKLAYFSCVIFTILLFLYLINIIF